MLANITFLLRESQLNLRRHGLLALASITTAAIALTIFGGFIVLSWQLHAVSEAIPRRLEIHAFPYTNATHEQVQALGQQIQALPGVARVRLVPKAEAWAEYQKHYPYPEDLQSLTENPLPDKLEIVAASPQQTFEVAAAIRALPLIEQVSDAKDILQKLLAVTGVVRLVGIGIAWLLALGTMAIIHNAIRMTLFARRRDIQVMQLVGASDGFIRLPFVVEGIVEGAAGGVLACAAMAGLLHYFTTRILPQVPFINEFQFAPSIPAVCAILVLGGAVLGMAASLFSLQRFLRAA